MAIRVAWGSPGLRSRRFPRSQRARQVPHARTEHDTRRARTYRSPTRANGCKKTAGLLLLWIAGMRQEAVDAAVGAFLVTDLRGDAEA